MCIAWLFWLTPIAGALCLSSEAPARHRAPVAIQDVTVVDVATGVLVPSQTVLIVGSRIHAVGFTGSVRVPPHATLIEGEGKYVIPGLVDAHAHLFNNVSRRPPSTWAFSLFVAQGVTGVREMWTQPAQAAIVDTWRRELAEGNLLAPRILAAGALVDGPGAWAPSMPKVATPTEGPGFVHEVAQAGLDFIKVYAHLPPETYRAILDEAHSARLPVDGHAPLLVRAADAAQAGQRTNEHLYQVREACTQGEGSFISEREALYAEPYDTEEEYALLDAHVHRAAAAYDEAVCERTAHLLAEAGQWQVPTLVNEHRWFLGVRSDQILDDRLAALPVEVRTAWLERYEAGNLTYGGDRADLQQGWKKTLQVVGDLNRYGVGLIVGTDFGAPFVLPGTSVHEEMALLVEAGLTPLQALQAATINPARALGLADSFGTVGVGKVADLVVLDANPLDRIEHTQAIHAVVLDGHLLQRVDLDALLHTEPLVPDTE